ncbi:mucin-binding protein [Latilactobacillus curvatus]|nr:MucBP domain-containing protein [Latilactobacillus curvatus]MDT7017539.1 MucBP domain-containing protein [Latilactobacillus curvatus]
MGEKKLHYKMYKDGKKFVFAAIATLSFFVFGGVSTVAVHADTTSGNLTATTVNSTSDTKSTVSSAATSTSSSAVRAETTSASSSSATKADSTSASSSSAVKTETTSASELSTQKDDVNSNTQQNMAIKTLSNLTDTDKNGIQTNWSSELSTQKDDVNSNTQQNMAIKTLSNLTDTDKNGIQTNWSSELSAQKDDVNSNTQQNMAIKTLSNLTDTDKNGIQTNWSRDKSADTGNSDSNPVSNEAGQYWPNTKGYSLKDYSKTATTDFTKDQNFNLGYNPTPVLQNSSDLSLYIRGQRVDLSKLADDDSLNRSAQYPGHTSKGHSRLISTSELGENTYFWAKNVFKIYNEITHKYDRYDLKWTLESVNYGDANTQIALGIKGSQDIGGTQLLNIGSGWQLAHLGNFFNTHLQFFKEENESASNEDPALAIANADVTAAAVSIHMGFSDIDSNEAVQLTSGVIKKVYVDDATQLAYQDQNGYLSVTRKYNDPSDVSGKNESKVTFLMEMDVPVEGFDLSVATIGNQKDSSNNYIHGQGSKVAPSLLSTMKYIEPLVIVYNKLDGNGNTTTESLQSPKMVEGLIGDKYTVDSTGNKVDTSAPSTIIDSDGNIWKLVKEKTQGNPNGSYVDGTNEIDYYYQISKGTITTHYIDENGHKIKEDTNSTGNVGNNYTTTGEPTITGSNGQTYYLDTKKTPANAAGKYTDGNTDVTYTYYEKGTVVTKYTDEKGNPLQNPTFTTDKEGNSFTTTALKSIVKDGVTYVLTAQPTNATGEYTNGETDVTYVYAPLTETLVIVNETINYIDQSGNSLPNIDSHQATPITFITVTNPVTKETTTYYKNGTQKQPTLDLDGQPDSTWTESNEANFQAVTNPTVPGYHVIKTTDPTNDLTQTTSKTVDITNGNLNYTVTYTKDAPTVTTESKTVNETIHYIYKDGSKAVDDHVAKPVEFTRQVSTDAVTGEKTYGAWSADQSFDAVTSPELKGYTADKAQIDKQTVTGDSKDLEFTVTYTKNAPTITTEKKTVNETIHYVYKDGSKAVDDHVAKPVEFTRQVSTDAVTEEKTYGAWSADQSFDAVTSPELKGYTADKAQIDKQTVTGDSKDLEFTVTYTKNAPTITTEKKTVNETIHYVYKDGTTAHDAYVATPVEFTRQVSTDAVTGEKTYGSWSADQSFAAVTSPAIKGYTPDQAQIDTITGITADSADIEKTVTYVANKEAAKVIYIDDKTGKTLSPKDLTGDYGSTDPYRTGDTIADYEKQGYQLVSDNYPTNGVVYNQDGTVQSFEVHLTHGTTQTSESQTVNETIHYVYKNGDKAADDYQATPLNFTRTVTTDKVTGEKTYGSWSADQSFAAVTSPTIKGYTPDQAQIDTITGITADSADIEKTVTYVANKEAAKVTYIDDKTGKTLSPKDLTGDYGSTDPYRTGDTIADYEKQGYQLVSDNYPTNGVVYNQDGTVQSFEVHLTHGTTQTSESQTVNETIHYVYKNGDKAADDYQATPLNFTRTVTTDKVTGEKTYGSWSADQSFAAVTSPAIKGYTPDQAEIDTITGITADSADIEKTVTYVANKEAAKVIYIDDKTGKTLSPKDLTGDYGSTDPYRTGDTIADYEKQGYQLVSDNYPTNGVVYNQDGTVQSFEVHLTHGTTQTSESQTVNETIHYVYKNGDKAADDYQATPLNFTRTVTTDKVTGEKTYGSWSADQSFAAVTSPAIKGYTPDQAEIDTITGITADSADIEKTVTYVANKEAAKVTYIDDKTGKTLSPKDLTGDYGSTDPYRTGDTIADYEKQGYQLVSDNYPTNGVVYNQDGTVQSFEVHLTHGTTQTSESQTVNETIHYVYKNGDKAADDYQATPLNFTRTVTTDKVTGEKTYGSWSADQSFAAVTSPAIKGYTPDQAEIDTITGITADSADIEKTVTYVANKEAAKVIYIDDKTGKTLSPKDLTGDYGSTDPYRTGDTIADYEKQGYQLVSDNYPTNGVVYNQDGTVQSFEVHLTHGTTPVGPNNPQTPGTPINPDDPDGPKWPEGTDKSSVTQTVIRTVNYLDKQTGKVVAKQVTEQVTYNRTAIVDKVTGQIIGYSTTGGNTVDQTDGDKAWTAVDNKSDWDSVTSPDLSSKGYLAPDLATVAQQTVTPGDKDVTVNVYYDHDVVPVNPTNPQTPGTPINPDDPDSPKWPAGTDKNSLTTDVHQTIHYQYGDGSQAAPDKTDSTTFDHQVEVDKVTGKIVKDDGWSAENDKTSFDAKVSPVIAGYTASQASSTAVTGLTQDSQDNVQTIVYAPNAETANVSYIDDTTGKTLSAKDLTGNYGSTDPYRTSETITGYERQGYQLVSDNYPTNGVVYNQDGTVQSFEVHLTHETTPVGPNNPQTPGEPINPDNPDGPKWPTGTDQSSLTQTITRTVNYYDNQTKAVVAKQVTEQVTYNRTAIVDKVTGQIIGYSTTGGNTVDQTDGSKAWIAKGGDTNWAAVTSPDLSSEGYTAPDLATVEQTTVNPGDKDATVNVYYDHVVVPVNPSKPETPGTPINPDNPDGPKWPTGTDKDSLTKSVNQTIHYQYSNGATAAPDKTDTTTFDHQVEVDKVTGKIVKDDGWFAENNKTSFDAKTSPVIAGYTASEASSKTVTGLTQDSPDDVQTIVYAPNAEKANVSYIDDTTGKTLSAKDLTGNYGSTDPYRTSETITGYERQGYQLVSDNYPTNGVVYNQDGTVQSFEVHLTHGTTQTSESQTVNETIHYVYKNGDKAADDYQATPLNFTRTVTTDKVTGKKTYGSWSADQSFAAVTSPAIKGYTPDQAEIGSQTVSGDSSDLDFTVVYAKNAPTITTESKTINETIHYVYKDGTTAHDDYVAKPVEFTREVSTDAVTGEKTYGLWSADQSFAAVTSPELKGYTADKAQIDKQTVNGDSKDLEFTVTYTKTPVAGGNVTAKYVDENGNPIADDVIASGNVGDPYSTTQKDVPGYTFKEVQGNPTGSFTDQDQTVTYVYTKNPATDNNGGTGLNQPGKPGNGTNNGVINTSTNTGSKVNNGAVNSPELPQTGENNSQSQTMSFIGILLAFGSLLGFLGIKKRRND